MAQAAAARADIVGGRNSETVDDVSPALASAW
jgi:hypothetical protein